MTIVDGINGNYRYHKQRDINDDIRTITKWARASLTSMPPEYDIAEMDGGRWGVYCRDEHIISFDTESEASDGAWASWLYDIGEVWREFMLQAIRNEQRFVCEGPICS